MRTSVCRGGLATVLALVALLSYQAGTVQAHPQFVGRWIAIDPKGANIVYDFGPADYITDGVWRGTFTLYVADIRITCGMYELRIETGTEGTIGLRDGVGITTCVGNVDVGQPQKWFMAAAGYEQPPGLTKLDLGKPQMWFKGVTYLKAPLRP